MLQPTVIKRAYKTELAPTPDQRERFIRNAGAVRFLYNLGLERCKDQYAREKKQGYAHRKRPSDFDLSRELTQLKKEPDAQWLNDFSVDTLQNALANLDTAYANFFRRIREGKRGKAAGFPRFKTKKKGLGSFRFSKSITVFPDAIKLPRLEPIALKEKGYLPVAGVKINSATVSEKAGRWYVSIQVEETIAIPDTNGGPSVGIDVGINRLATLSDGTTIDNPRTYRKNLRKQRHLSKAVSRKVQGSGKRRKAVRQLAKQHQRVARVRQHHLHIHTTAITKRYAVVVIEDLNVAGMAKNRRLAQSILDASFYEFRRQLEYKAQWYGCQIVVADQWFPSSRLCSACGWKKTNLTLKDRVFCCEACGLVVDRDLNAAQNLLALVADKQSDTQNARREDVGPERIASAIVGEAGNDRAQTSVAASM